MKKCLGGFRVVVVSSGSEAFAQLWEVNGILKWYSENNWYRYEAAKRI